MSLRNAVIVFQLFGQRRIKMRICNDVPSNVIVNFYLKKSVETLLIHTVEAAIARSVESVPKCNQ